MSALGPIGAIPLMPVGALAPASDGASGAAPAEGFAGALANAVGSLNGQLVQADRLQEAAASGQLADPTVALVETEKADIALQLATQVRNKLVEGWQELSRMPV